MDKNKKKIIDKIIAVVFYIIFSPIVLLYAITKCTVIAIEYLFEKLLNPLYCKTCKLIRKPIPNSTVHVKEKDDRYFKRKNEKLLTIKEAKALGKQYEEQGYEVHLSLSEL